MVVPTVADVAVNVAELAAAEAAEATNLSLMQEMRMPSPLSEAEAPATAATRVNFKSLDYSRTIRCDGCDE